MTKDYPEDQQPISMGEIANVQGRVDDELERIPLASVLMDMIWGDDLFQDMTPTEKDVALGYLDSIREEQA